MQQKLSIIIPVYNEAATITDLLDRVAAVRLDVDKELVIVNDGSTDESARLIRDWRDSHPALEITVLTQENRGKGAAVRTGIAASQGDVVIIQDADLEYDPNDYRQCIAPILYGDAAVVYGSRERFKENHRHSSLAFYFGGMLVSLWFSILYQTRLTDEPTCYKTFKGKLVRALPIDGDGFEWEPEVTAKLLRAGVKIHEVPITYRPRKIDEGKKINWKDGMRALAEALRWRFKPLGELRTAIAEASRD